MRLNQTPSKTPPKNKVKNRRLNNIDNVKIGNPGITKRNRNSNVAKPQRKSRKSKKLKGIMKLSVTGKNFYNPNKAQHNPGEKRMVILDGSNVACGFTNSRILSAEGLEIAIRFFERLGHETKAVVPQFRLNASETTNQSIMNGLKRDGKLVLTPSKNLPGKMGMSYDDRFILQIAEQFDAAVVSNDNYRDLLNESTSFRNIIENRVIGFTWFKDMFMVPEDPYGQRGPTLEQILHF